MWELVVPFGLYVGMSNDDIRTAVVRKKMRPEFPDFIKVMDGYK